MLQNRDWGACSSIGLSELGHEEVKKLEASSAVEPSAGSTSPDGIIAGESILLVETFAGMGASSFAFELLGVALGATVFIEIDKPSRKVLSTRWPEALMYSKVEDIDEETVRSWRKTFPKVRHVVHSDGFPCKDVSRLNVHGQGLAGSESGLLYEALRLHALLEK